MNTSTSTAQSFRKSSCFVKGSAFIVTAMILSACNNGSDSFFEQSIQTAVNDIDKKNLLSEVEPTLTPLKTGLEFIELNLGIKGEGTNLIELQIDELSLQQVLNGVGFLPTSVAVSHQITTTYKNIPAVSSRKITVNKMGAFTVKDLNPQTYYHFVARACIDGTEDGQCSPAVNVLYKTLSLPLEEVTITKAAPSSVDVELGWSAARGADMYRIERRENGKQWRSIFGDLFVLGYTDTTVVSGVSYQYRVQACQFIDASQSDSAVECEVSSAHILEAPIAENYRTTLFPSTNVQAEAGLHEVDITITSLDVSEFFVYDLEEYTGDQYTTLQTIDASSVAETEHKVQHTGREPATKYDYRVRACLATEPDNCYKWYSFHATTLLQPAQPVVITGEVLGATSNKITWTADTIATSYAVSRRLVTTNTYQEIGVVLATDSTMYTDTGVTPNTEYVYVVASCIVSGQTRECSDPSNEVMLQTDIDLTGKNSIANLVVTALISEPNQLTISWDAYNPAPDFYQIDVSQDGGQGWIELSTIKEETRYLHQKLIEGTVYQYRVRACIRNTENCTPDAVRTGETPTPENYRTTLFPSTNVQAEARLHEVDITITSLDVPEFFVYDLEEYTGDQYTTLQTIDASSVAETEHKVQHTGREPATKYDYRVRACLATEPDNCYKWYSFHATTLLQPAQPVVITGEVLGATSNKITWAADTIATSYAVSRRLVTTNTYQEIGVVLATDSTMYTDTGVTPNTEYVYVVASCIVSGQTRECSDPSNEVMLQTDIDLTGKNSIANLVVTALISEPNQLTISWDAYNPAPDFYQIDVSQDGGQGWIELSTIKEETRYLHQGSFLEGTVYQYRVRACIRDTENCTPVAVKTGGRLRLHPTITAKLVIDSGTDVTVKVTEAIMTWDRLKGFASISLKARKKALDSRPDGAVDEIVSFGVLGSHSQTRAQLPNLEPDKQYQFYLYLCDLKGVCQDTTSSSQWLRTQKPVPILNSPSPTFNGQNATLLTSVDLGWSYQDSHSQTPEYFVLENKTRDRGVYKEIDGAITAGTRADAIIGGTRTITNLSPGTYYVARIKACVVEDGTERCSLWGFTEYITKALPQVFLQAFHKPAPAPAHSIYLRWTDVAGLRPEVTTASYTVHQSTASFEDIGIENYNSTFIENYETYSVPSNNSMEVMGLSTGTKYYFRVTANISEGLVLAGNEVGVTVKARLNDTGITFSRGDISGNNPNCPDNVVAPQDCNQGRDATHNYDRDGHAGFSFTKLDSDGTDLSSDATSWSCVRDNVTGLMWEVKTITGSADSPTDIRDGVDTNIHHKDNLYRWGGTTAIGLDHAEREGNYYSDWNTLVHASNTDKFCGYDDWRVPTIEELLSISNLGVKHPTPAIDENYFPYVSDIYWSAEPAASGNSAWYVNFGRSSVGNLIRGGSGRSLRLVRD